MGDPAIDIAGMSQEERLALIEELWESLSDAERDAIPLTPEQEREMDARLDVLEREGPTGLSSKEIRERIKRRPS